MRHAGYFTIIQQPGSIEQVFTPRISIPLRSADDHPYPVGMLLNSFNSFIAFADKILKLQKIPWGIAANRQFGKNHQLRLSALRFPYCFYDLFRIAFKIPYMIVLLC